MANAVTFDLFARDRASGAFVKVGNAAQQAGGHVDRLSRSFAGISVGSRGVHASFGLIAKGAALAAGTAGLAALVGGFRGVYSEAREAQRTGAQTAAVIKSTGGVAKVSATQVGALATAISNKVGVDDEAIQSGQNLLLTFTGVRNEAGKGNDVFNQASKTIVDMTAAMNGGTISQEGLKASAIQVGKALNDPVKGLTALRKVGVSFTQQQQDQIKAMVASGNTLGAQKVILGELNKEFGGSAAAGTNAMQKLGVVFGNIKESIGTALLPIIDRLASWLGSRLPGAIDKVVLGVRAFVAAFREGDVTSDGFVGVMERLGNVARAVAGFVTGTVLPGFRALFAAFREGDVTSDGFVGVMERVGVILRAVSGWVSEHRALVLSMAKGVAVVTAAFVGLRVVIAAVNLVMAVNPIGLVVVALGLLVGAVVYAYKHSERFRAIVATVWAAVQGFGAFLASTFGPTIHAIADTFARNVVPALTQLWAAVQRNLPAFISLAKFIGGVIAVVGFLVLKLAGFLLPILIQVGGFLIGKLVNFISTTIGYIGGLVRSVQSAWKGFQTFLAVVSGVWTSFIAVARTAIAFVVRTFLGMVGTILSGAATAFGWIPGIGPKLKEGARQFRIFAAGVNAALDSTTAPRTTEITARLRSLGITPHGTAGLAKGGVVPFVTDGPRAIVGEGRRAYPEYVIPTDPQHRTRALSLYQELGAKMYAAGGKIGLNVSPRLSGARQFDAAIAAFNKRVDDVTVALARSLLGGGRVVEFAKRQAGKPYVWGAAGPGGYDCSGFISALVNVARGGGSPYHRLFSTDTLPAGYFAPGAGRFTIGWMNAMQSSSGVGHVAATVNGVNMESRGGDGVVVGSRSGGAGYSYFRQRGHLKGFARGGTLPGDPPFDLLDPRGRYYRAGLLDALESVQRGHKAMAGGGVIREPVLGIGRSGRTYGFGERGPETVTPGVGGGGLHVHFHGPVYGANSRELAQQLRQPLKELLRQQGKTALANSI